MSDANDVERCDFCKRGRVAIRNQPISFRQWTDKGYVFCRAEIPIGVCDRCGAKHWNQVAEAIIEEVVRREYDKLPMPAAQWPHATPAVGRGVPDD
jgi:hypothetical protein